MTLSKPAPARRNPGSDLHTAWLHDLEGPLAETEARVTEVSAWAPRDVTQRASCLHLAVGLLDLTSLDEADTEETIRVLCVRARTPLGPSDATPLFAEQSASTVAAVCVYDRWVPAARNALLGSTVRVAAVTGGFPRPHSDLERRLAEIAATVEAGADEIDVVVTPRYSKDASWDALYEEVVAIRMACGPARLKTILAAGELGSLDTVARAGFVCCMAGADFIKSSTGREEVNATLPIGVAMCEAIRSYGERTGHAVGFKPAGGIRTADQALSWLHLVREGLGPDWLEPDRFRIGASSLLTDLARHLKREV